MMTNHTASKILAERMFRLSRALSGCITVALFFACSTFLDAQSSPLTVQPSTGRVGIGTTAPAATLHVAGDVTVDGLGWLRKETNWFAIRAAGNPGGSIFVGDDATGWSVLLRTRTADTSSQVQIQKVDGALIASFNGDGNVGIGTSSPDFLLHVNGTAGKPGGGSWSTASDARLKTNIQDLDGTLDKLLRLRGVGFEYKDPKAISELSGNQIGMIAQEVEQVFPQWVDEGTDGYKRVTYRGFEALTVEALRQLRDEKDKEIASLRETVERQQSQFEALREEMDRLLGKLRLADSMPIAR